MPSVPLQLFMGPLVPSLTSFHGGTSSHRLKHLEKSDRRDRERTWESDSPGFGVIKIAKNLLLLMDTQFCDLNVLGDALDKSLNIQSAQETDSASDGHEEEEDLCEKAQTCQAISSKRLDKCVTFPSSNMMLPASSSEEETETVSRGIFPEESKDQAYSRSISLPTPLKLVSALKGSRGKEGVLQGKLTVKWAPDVYDPIPTSVSHSVKSKSLQKSKNKKNEKRNGKKGQKGNCSQGGGRKDKKQTRKAAKASDKCGNFEVGGSNSYCGSSFRRKSHAEVHYSIGEAS